MRALHAYDFRIICLVCDGESNNMKVLKHTLGITGAFPIDTEFRWNGSFNNPFETEMKCYLDNLPFTPIEEFNFRTSF